MRLVLSSVRNPIDYIDIRTFAHATEDTDKVVKALRNLLPAEVAQDTTFSRTALTGHHGNPITLFETRIKDRLAAQKAFAHLSLNLSMLERELLCDEIQNHIEKGKLYLRFDKQKAYLGEFKLGQTDPIHFRVHFKKHTLQEVTDICRRFGLIP